MSKKPFKSIAHFQCCSQVTFLMRQRFAGEVPKIIRHGFGVTSEYRSWWLSFSLESTYEQAIQSVFKTTKIVRPGSELKKTKGMGITKALRLGSPIHSTTSPAGKMLYFSITWTHY